MNNEIHRFADGPFQPRDTLQIDPRFIRQLADGQVLNMNRMRKIRQGAKVVAEVELSQYWRGAAGQRWKLAGTSAFVARKRGWPRREGPVYLDDPWWCPETDAQRRSQLRRWRAEACTALVAGVALSSAAWAASPWAGLSAMMLGVPAVCVLWLRAWRYQCPPSR